MQPIYLLLHLVHYSSKLEMDHTPTSLALHFLIILPILFTFTPQISAQFSFLDTQCSNTTYTPNSTFGSNLNQVLNSLSTDTRITYGFYNFSAGQPPNRVEATALCRADVTLATCRDCVRQSAAGLPGLCPEKKGAFGYSEDCVLFYNKGSIFRRVLINPAWIVWDNLNVSDMTVFNRTLYGLLGRLQNEAASGDSQLKYAAGKADVSRNQTIYAQVQCTPDLTRLGCIQCVQGSLADFRHIITPTFISAGARRASPSCNLRYEVWLFYSKVEALDLPPAPAPSSNTSTTTKQGGQNKKSHNAVVIIVPVIVGSVILLIAAFICIIWRRKKLRKYRGNFDKEENETLRSLQFSLGAIKAATADFSDHNKLGQGGFGIVYKGNLPDGQEVAVKRLSRNSGQGDVQFKNEILTLAKLQHRNLVRLLGFCLEGEEMILIYEFMMNKSLDIFLLDPEQRAFLPWETRYKLINGIARGLQYLHEDSRLRIIHRDLKAGNVLLDGEFNPKIADFGMARLFEMDQTRFVTNKIVGTYGYMPPEYVQHGHVSLKLDVFSFGVLVLEIISGQMISSFTIEENSENLLSFAWTNWQEGTPWNMVDPALPASSKTEILRCIHIGLLCIQHNPAERPTMSSIALMLSSSSMSLPVPSQPAFFTRRNTTVPNMPDTKRSGTESINEVSMTELCPR